MNNAIDIVICGFVFNSALPKDIMHKFASLKLYLITSLLLDIYQFSQCNEENAVRNISRVQFYLEIS